MKRSCLFITLLLLAPMLEGQVNIDSLRGVWNDGGLPDTVRLKALNTLAWNGYLFSDPDSACYYGRMMYDYAERKGLKREMAMALRGQGVCFKVRDQDALALDLYLKSMRLSEEAGDENGVAGSLNNIGLLYMEQGNAAKALDYHQRSLVLREMHGDHVGAAASLRNIGAVHEHNGELEEALSYYQRSLERMRALKKLEGIAWALSDMSNVHLALGDTLRALEEQEEALQMRETANDQWGAAASLNAIGRIQLERGHLAEALRACKSAARKAVELGSIEQQKQACECHYKAYKHQGRNDLALYHLEHVRMLTDSMHDQELTLMLKGVEFAQQARADSLAKAQALHQQRLEHWAQVRKKNTTRDLLIVASLFALMASLGLWSRLRYIRRAKARLEREKDRSDQLLLNILPAHVAEELKERGSTQARNHDQVTILFTDFQDFTQIASGLSPSDLVRELNTCYEAFDAICRKHGIEKVKTIGDAYMAAGGLHGREGDAALNTVLAGLEMQGWLKEHARTYQGSGRLTFAMRLGVHTGPVVAGVVGVHKWQYDLWGDTVNTANRMETSGQAGKVNISEATHELVKDAPGLRFTSRGKVQVKGKGALDMYFVDLRRVAEAEPEMAIVELI